MAREWTRKLGINFILGCSNIDVSLGDINYLNFRGSRRSPILAWRYVFFARTNGITHVYSREEKLLGCMMLIDRFLPGRKLLFAYEAHSIPLRHSCLYLFMIRFVSLIVVVTERMRAEFIKMGISPQKIRTEHDAVDLNLFSFKTSKREVREELALCPNDWVVGYFGRFQTMGMEKGVPETLLAVKRLTSAGKRVFFIGVGLRDRELPHYQKIAKELGVFDHVRLIGYLPQEEVPRYQCACNALLLLFPRTAHFEKYMSPLKMFEYMASGIPIIATRLPSIEEVLDNKSAYFVDSLGPECVAEAIIRVCQNPAESFLKARKARERVTYYTWSKRVERITHYLNNL